MSEESMVAVVQDALSQLGVDDRIDSVGQFYPRGHTGGMFVGGLSGGAVGDAIGGGVGDAIGLGAGSIAGAHAADAASGLPGLMLVGVSATTVYGFGAKSRSKPTDLVFTLAREDLEVKVHQRVNVRILELIHTPSGSTVQLEGNRIPVTHSKDVIDALSS
jgi:hypothetical protein